MKDANSKRKSSNVKRRSLSSAMRNNVWKIISWKRSEISKHKWEESDEKHRRVNSNWKEWRESNRGWREPTEINPVRCLCWRKSWKLSGLFISRSQSTWKAQLLIPQRSLLICINRSKSFRRTGKTTRKKPFCTGNANTIFWPEKRKKLMTISHSWITNLNKNALMLNNGS